MWRGLEMRQGIFYLNFCLILLFLGTVRPKGGNIAALNVLRREKKEAKLAKNTSASLLAAASRSHTSPIDLSERPMQTLIFSISPPSAKPEKQVAA